MKIRGRLVQLATVTSFTISTTEGFFEDALGLLHNSTTCEGTGSKFDAFQWMWFVGSWFLGEWLESPRSSSAPEREQPFPVIRGGSTSADNWFDRFMCRNKVVSSPHGGRGQPSVGPYALWGKSYSAVRSLDEMSSDDDDTFFTSRATRQTTEKVPEPRLPVYPEDYPGDSPPIADHSRDEISEVRSETLLNSVGDALSESEQEMRSHHLSNLLHFQDGEEGIVPDDKFRPHSPIFYRYFGRSRVRTHRTDSISFIMIGPCVDHWKSVGQILASRGFNVMACERVESRQDGIAATNSQVEEGENLVLSVLDALKWNKAVIVGCDSESHLAVEAALRLSPEKVAGLVLCGELSSANDFVSESTSTEQDARNFDAFSLDSYLSDNLDCPFAIIWDGGIPPALKRRKTALGDMLGGNRCLILGGGTAPHRRLPEQFAWVLTRFVEEKVASQLNPGPVNGPSDMSEGGGFHISDNGTSSDRIKRMHLPDVLEEFFSPETFIVAGRVAAAALFYITALKVVVYQYENVRSGMLGLRLRYETVSSWRKQILRSVLNFVHYFGSVFVHQKPVLDPGSDNLQVESNEEVEDDASEDSEEVEDDASEDNEEVEDDPSEQEGNEEPRHIDYYLDRVVV